MPNGSYSPTPATFRCASSADVVGDREVDAAGRGVAVARAACGCVSLAHVAGGELAANEHHRGGRRARRIRQRAARSARSLSWGRGRSAACRTSSGRTRAWRRRHYRQTMVSRGGRCMLSTTCAAPQFVAVITRRWSQGQLHLTKTLFGNSATSPHLSPRPPSVILTSW